MKKGFITNRLHAGKKPQATPVERKIETVQGKRFLWIDLQNPDNRQELFNFLREEMSDDKAKHKILPPSKFGLVQITRQRVRPEVNIETREENPNNLSGDVDAPIQIIDKAEVPLNSSKPNKTKIMLIFSSIGFFTALLIAFTMI